MVAAFAEMKICAGKSPPGSTKYEPERRCRPLKRTMGVAQAVVAKTFRWAANPRPYRQRQDE
jgi:hypothetical protein